MATISGRTMNRDGSRTWPGCVVYLILESDGSRVDATSSDANGAYSFTVGDMVTEYTVLAEATGVRMGARNGVTGV